MRGRQWRLELRTGGRLVATIEALTLLVIGLIGVGWLVVATTFTQRSEDCCDPAGKIITEDTCSVLAQASAGPGALEFPLRSDSLVIGRTGGGADIELEDPLLDDRHAELKRTQYGAWTIASNPSGNGIWVSISATVLAPLRYFRCGEQRFRFVIP